MSDIEIGGDAIPFAGLPRPMELHQIRPVLQFYALTRGKETKKILTIGHNSVREALNDETFKKYTLRCKRVVFVTHGFGSGILTLWMHDMKQALLHVDPQIVALVGWGDGAVSNRSIRNITKWAMEYKLAASNCLEVGRWLGRWVCRLSAEMKRWKMKERAIWGIGHSLGAHLMGMAGQATHDLREKYKLQGHVFGRITGLDPAGPGFQTGLRGYRRICKYDAGMVDIIHTDGMALATPYFGTLLPLGTIDFYPNYGYGSIISNPVRNHTLAIQIFIWSIGRAQFQSKKVLCYAPKVVRDYPTGVRVLPCIFTKTSQTKAKMGYYADTAARNGNYYVKIQIPLLVDFEGCLLRLESFDGNYRREISWASHSRRERRRLQRDREEFIEEEAAGNFANGRDPEALGWELQDFDRVMQDVLDRF